MTIRLPRRFTFTVDSEPLTITDDNAHQLPKQLHLPWVGEGSNRAVYLLPTLEYVLKLAAHDIGSNFYHRRYGGQIKHEKKVWKLAVEKGLSQHLATLYATGRNWSVQEYIPESGRYADRLFFQDVLYPLPIESSDITYSNYGYREGSVEPVQFDYGYATGKDRL